MAKRVGRPTNVPFEQMLGNYDDSKPRRVVASPRRQGQFLADAEAHRQELKAGGINLPEYGAKRRESMNAFQTGKPPYAFRPKNG